jgi:two-component system response regulator HydG
VVLSKTRTLGRDDFSFLKVEHTPALRPRSLRELERTHIQGVLDECAWNVTQAAKILGINRVTLHKKMKRHSLVRP